MDKTTKQLLEDLIVHGKSQHENSRHTKVGQATLSRIINGVNKAEYSRVHGQILDYYKTIFTA